MTHSARHRPVRVFGSAAQQRMQRTAHHLWPLLRQMPDYGYEGRMVGIDGATGDAVAAIAALTRIQGASVSHYIPLRDEHRLTQAMQGAGLATDRWDQFMGGAECLDICRRTISAFEMPQGYGLHRVDPSTQDTVLDGLSETALDCGVLPLAHPVLSGQTQDAVCYLLLAPDGGVAACAGAVMRNHPQSAYATAAWWGMLATRPADRGMALSLFLGAKAALWMHDRFGATEVYTGVRKDNDVSRHVCNKLGVVESDYCCLAILDPEQFGDGGYTK